MTDDTPAAPSRRAVMAGLAAPFLGVVLPALATPAAAQAQTPGAVLVTGASRGFGRLTAETFARAGQRVIASMREVSGRNAPIAAELAATARREGWRLDVVEIDIDQDASVERGVARALDLADGRIDTLVNNAGIIVPGPVELSMDAARRQFETNVFGQLRMLRAVAPGMRERRTGLIVHVSSGLGRFVLPTNGVYCATKFATEAMMESAAYELHPFGVELALVQPSAFATNFKPAGRAALAALLASLDAADRRRAADYADHMRITEERMRDEPTPPPQMVADAILALARLAPGEGPLRVAAMPPQQAEGIGRLNATLEGIQQGILRGNGMAAWLTLARS